MSGVALHISSIRSSRRRSVAAAWPALRRLGLLLACGIASTWPAWAGETTVRGAEMSRYGRIALTFDQATKVSARATNGVLVISFAEPSTIREERLPAEMPGYVSTVRHDPDRTGLRVALVAPFRVNVLEAGEKVFIDLLPENWTGLPPGLPPDVVAELARRAQEAEARIQAESLRRQIEGLKPMRARVASLPSLTRIVFEPPNLVPVNFAANGSEVTLLFEAPLALDRSQIAGQLAPAVRSFIAEAGGDTLLVRLTLADGYEARGFREDEAFVLDVAEQDGRTPFHDLKPVAPAPGRAPKETKTSSKTQPESAVARDIPTPQQPVRDGSVQPKPEQGRAPLSKSPVPVRARPVVTSEGLRVVFPFAGRVAAAGFQRSGLLTLVFHTTEPLPPFDLPPEATPLARMREVVREGDVAIVRFDLAKPQVARLAPDERSWVLTVGDNHGTPSRPLDARRNTDDSNRAVVTVPLPEASGVHWIADPQNRESLAVVTAFGAPSGFPKPQRFVEFTLVPTFQGVVVAAVADDVRVRAAFGDVIISRNAGLSVSMLLPSERRTGHSAVTQANLVIQRERWVQARLGDVQKRQRDLLHAAADAPRSGRAAARIELAQFLLANGLAHEAEAVLAHAGQEDPFLENQRQFNLLRGVAQLRMGRIAGARTALSSPALAEDVEAVLWRAALDAEEKRWASALGGFVDSAPVLEAYPEDLQAGLRLKSVRAAIEMRDFAHADSELTAVAPMVTAAQHNEMQLLRARLDELGGRPEVAIDTYRRLMASAGRPAAAKATLAWIELALQHGMIDGPSAIPQLETLAVIWRGDDVEAGALGRLGRLYAESGRWRDAFTTARRAYTVFPDHPVTRSLHDDTARLFEELFLTGRGDTLSRVDSLALFFDFREFTPIGARGDEIVRRLADRLVGLDLLEQAAALLQHQVDNRLTGAARATVAARLATVLLMDSRPAQALQALRATRLPELPRSTSRARLLLEARALSDLSRTDLAMELLEGEAGPEIDRLRADILWTGGRWRQAGEAHEKLVGSRWQGDAPLSDQDRNDLMRAAIAYSLGEDALALDRLRAKFATKMADSADARTFSFVTRPNVASTRAFRELARSVTSADTLSDFLAEYRKRYPDASAAERPKRNDAPPAGDQPQAQATEPTPESNG